MSLSYGQIETALAHAFGVAADEQPKWFRGRIRHFQKLGMPIGMRSSPGHRLTYSTEHMMQLAICLEFAEFGFEPNRIVSYVSKYWYQLRRPLLEDPLATLKSVSGEDLMRSTIMLFSPRGGAIHNNTAGPEGHPDYIQLKTLDKLFVSQVYLQGGQDRTHGARRVGAINITVLARSVNEGLDRPS